MLDVGCGTGHLLAAAACGFPHTSLVGADLSAAMLSGARYLRLAAAQIHFVQAAVEHLSFAEAEFDVVTSTVSFRHWTDQHAGLREIHRVLTPGGCVILAEVFAARRQKWINRLHGTSPLPQTLTQPTLSAIGLDVVMVDYVAGFGPAPEITVIAAQRN
jgi:ubiquinone/menaquinone biosynthesis C-methylase UbiE